MIRIRNSISLAWLIGLGAARDRNLISLRTMSIELRRARWNPPPPAALILRTQHNPFAGISLTGSGSQDLGNIRDHQFGNGRSDYE
jgi:hypothetical protein